MTGPDHSASINFEELKLMVKSIRNVEKSLGSGIKTTSKSEQKNLKVVRKSIVAKINIKKGEKFTEQNLTTKRPSDGISPMKWDTVIGKKAKKNFNADSFIKI